MRGRAESLVATRRGGAARHYLTNLSLVPRKNSVMSDDVTMTDDRSAMHDWVWCFLFGFVVKRHWCGDAPGVLGIE